MADKLTTGQGFALAAAALHVCANLAIHYCCASRTVPMLALVMTACSQPV
jgi:hypothetical protein